ncbi:hypothetical protein AB0I22_02875 [Streptomyces sp. NPDC050610]|uniref:hypothetical protein n=1 Tax=Streptomyces sp. NPDC050610 TaxID=3157097 RepID=UPI003449791F
MPPKPRGDDKPGKGFDVLLTLVTTGGSDVLAAGLGVEVEASVAAIATGVPTGAVYEGVFSMTIDAVRICCANCNDLLPFMPN